MNQVEIYSHPTCIYCHRAKGLLKARGIDYKELNVAHGKQLVKEMIQRTGGRTFPQIIINGKPIGGFDSLHRMDKNQELGTLLK